MEILIFSFYRRYLKKIVYLNPNFSENKPIRNHLNPLKYMKYIPIKLFPIDQIEFLFLFDKCILYSDFACRPNQ